MGSHLGQHSPYTPPSPWAWCGRSCLSFCSGTCAHTHLEGQVLLWPLDKDMPQAPFAYLWSRALRSALRHLVSLLVLENHCLSQPLSPASSGIWCSQTFVPDSCVHFVIQFYIQIFNTKLPLPLQRCQLGKYVLKHRISLKEKSHFLLNVCCISCQNCLFVSVCPFMIMFMPP